MVESQLDVKFPHYKPEEIEVMRRFLALNRLEGIYTFWVVLDTPQSVELRRKHASEPTIWMWQKQIDAICETEKEIWIIEVKERVRPSAVGQLLVYQDLYVKQYNPVKNVKKLLIARLDDPSIHDTLKRYKIRWELV